jgi:hypothetical protein
MNYFNPVSFFEWKNWNGVYVHFMILRPFCFTQCFLFTAPLFKGPKWTFVILLLLSVGLIIVRVMALNWTITQAEIVKYSLGEFLI